MEKSLFPFFFPSKEEKTCLSTSKHGNCSLNC